MIKSVQVVENLKEDIQNGILKPGDKLPSEAQLCAKYNISRTSIRSAIQSLAGQGIVDTYQGKGSFVSKHVIVPMSPQLMLANFQATRTDIFEFRRMVETESAAFAASRADEQTLLQLRASIINMQNASTPEDIIEHDMEFHYIIAETTKNAIIPEIFNMLRPIYHKFFIENVVVQHNIGYRDHLKILSAIENRSPQLASKYMEEHLNKSMMQSTLRTYEGTEQDIEY